MLNKLTSISIALCFAVLAVAAVAPNASADGVAVQHFEFGADAPNNGGDYDLDLRLAAHPEVSIDADGPSVDPALVDQLPHEGSAGATITSEPKVWVSTPSAVHFPMNGAWTVALTYRLASADGPEFDTAAAAVDAPTIAIGAWDGTTCQAFQDQTVDLSVAQPVVTRQWDYAVGTVVLPDDAFVDAGTSICVTVSASATYELSAITPSTLTSPTTPADLPVPNVGALVLLSIGGLMVSGVVYMRRF